MCFIDLSGIYSRPENFAFLTQGARGAARKTTLLKLSLESGRFASYHYKND